MRSLRWWLTMAMISVSVAYAIAYGRGVADRLDTAERDRTALAQQVRQLGGVPVAGPKGSDGRDGVDGREGLPGQDGSPGPTGAPGVEGPEGPVGPSGAVGTDGKPGATGPTGAQGPEGPVGPQGPAGPRGDQGPPAEACPQGYEGAIVEIREQDYFLCRKVT